MIVIAIFILKVLSLQDFIPSAIALIMALHFVLLGVFLRIDNLKRMGWIMVVIIPICDLIFAPISNQLSVENWIMIGFSMGIVLWINVLATAIRIRKVGAINF